jgi:hypothetical protein
VPLVEPMRLDVVVRREHPQTAAPCGASDVLNSSEQCGTDTDQPGRRMQRQELATVSIDQVRGHTRQIALRSSQHGRVIQRVDQYAASRHPQRVPIPEEHLKRRSMLSPTWY